MDATEKIINTFATRVREMILHYQELRKEKQELQRMVSERDTRISELEAQLRQARNDYDSLKMARMVEISDGDMETAKKRLAKLIRDVNKCITLLSNK
jgi:predicted  nucleic acid-binding Zn-ribbon protein